MLVYIRSDNKSMYIMSFKSRIDSCCLSVVSPSPQDIFTYVVVKWKVFVKQQAVNEQNERNARSVGNAALLDVFLGFFGVILLSVSLRRKKVTYQKDTFCTFFFVAEMSCQFLTVFSWLDSFLGCER